MELKLISPNRLDVQAMFAALNQHHLAHCPSEICHLTSADELERDGCFLIGALERDTLCGIGGVKLLEGYGEITRMYVAPEHRGKLIAERILEKLIALASEHGRHLIRLETSDKFEAAMKLYLKHGFAPCPAFGDYVDEPYNTYLEKRL